MLPPTPEKSREGRCSICFGRGVRVDRMHHELVPSATPKALRFSTASLSFKGQSPGVVLDSGPDPNHPQMVLSTFVGLLTQTISLIPILETLLSTNIDTKGSFPGQQCELHSLPRWWHDWEQRRVRSVSEAASTDTRVHASGVSVYQETPTQFLLGPAAFLVGVRAIFWEVSKIRVPLGSTDA